MEDAARTITKIELQRKNRNKASIFLDGEYAFSLGVDIVSRHGLKAGETLPAPRLALLQREEERRQIKERAYRYLSYRAHSEKELQQKLERSGFGQEPIAEVLAELKANRLLNDDEFARSFARSKLAKKPMGERRLRQELWKKGVDKEIIDATVSEIYADADQLELARTLVARTAPRYKHLEPQRRARRVRDLLLRQGFSWEIVRQVLEFDVDAE
ncbi:MAG: hypothetical protein D6743_07450 [Calditrichaeota bacterium]|nr:MAG: hypothetical protein D6743_07450 [Calditrichota bacterium]